VSDPVNQFFPMARMVDDDRDGWPCDEDNQKPKGYGTPSAPTRTSRSRAVDGQQSQDGEGQRNNGSDSRIFDRLAAKGRIKVWQIALAHAGKLAKG
jgi:hypothetical protein